MTSAAGTAMLDFGAFPGKSDASVPVTGQTGILATSLVEAWIRPINTEDHLSDEHLVESLRVVAGDILAGTGFTIYGFNTSEINEAMEEVKGVQTATTGILQAPTLAQQQTKGGRGTRLWGRWGVQWVWSD